ncbi:MAG: hypothetical protein IKZ92_04840 [Muribaculaceae bacterium]|nr:hypothetical protein [Muribaculaceae bacterium]
MSFLLLILILLFLIGIPLLRGWLFMQNLRRHVNESFRGRQEHERPRRDDDDDEYTETGDRKIYGSTEGEYAEYEEVSGTVIEEISSTGETRTIIEEQVTDAEYEEINP